MRWQPAQSAGRQERPSPRHGRDSPPCSTCERSRRPPACLAKTEAVDDRLKEALGFHTPRIPCSSPPVGRVRAGDTLAFALYFSHAIRQCVPEDVRPGTTTTAEKRRSRPSRPQLFRVWDMDTKVHLKFSEVEVDHLAHGRGYRCPSRPQPTRTTLPIIVVNRAPCSPDS